MGRRRYSAMIDSFAAWLRGYLIESGLPGLVRGMLGILTFGALISVLFGVLAIKVVAVVAALLGVMGAFTILLIKVDGSVQRTSPPDPRRGRDFDKRESDASQRWSCKSWCQRFEVYPNGDVAETIVVKVVSECDSLDFFSLVSGPGWDWPTKYRRRVRFEVRTATLGFEGGTRADVFHSWLSRNRLKLFVCLREPIGRGDEASFVAKFEWPAKCRPLVQDRCAEDFVLVFGEAVPHVEIVVSVPVRWQVRFDRIGVVGGIESSVVSNLERNDRAETALTVRDLPKQHPIGMRLELHQAVAS